MFVYTSALSTHPNSPFQALDSKVSFILRHCPGIPEEPPVEQAPELLPHLVLQRCDLAMLLLGQIFGCSDALRRHIFEVRYLRRIKEDLQSLNASEGFGACQTRSAIPSSTFKLIMTGISRTPSYDFEEYTEEQLKFADLIDPPSGVQNTMHTSTPNSSPSKRRITLTGAAIGSIRRVANEREEANRREEANARSPQPASDEEGRPHHNPLVPPIATLSSVPPNAPGPTAGVAEDASRRSESLGPFGYVPHGNSHGGQPGAVYPPSSTSPVPFGYPPIGSAAHPAQNVAQAYPPYHPAYPNHLGAAYGFHYPYGAHPNGSTPTSHPLPLPPPPSTSPSLPPQLPQPPQPPTASSLPPQPQSTSHLQPLPPLVSTSSNRPAVSTTVPLLPGSHPATDADLEGGLNIAPSNAAPSNKSAAETSVEAPAVVNQPTSNPTQDVENDSDGAESLFDGDLSDPGPLPSSPSKANGRPSWEKIEAADELCRKIVSYIAKKCADGNLETMLVYDRLCGKVLKSKNSLHEWNEYQSYVIAEQNKAKELGRLDGTDLAWDGVSNPTPEQIAKAWQLFKAEHGEEVKNMMEMWAMVKEIVTSQTQGERKRDFLSVQNQLINLINWVYNRYNIHIWAILAGGLSRSDQTFSLLCELNMCKGFSQVLGVAPEVIARCLNVPCPPNDPSSYQNALKVSNQQFAAMGAMRGLKVTGPGVDEESPVSALPTSVLPPPSAASTPKKQKPNPMKEDVRAVVKARIDECLAVLGRSFTRKTLPWSTLAHECIEVGVQVVNYPLSTLFPWEEPQTTKTAGKKPSNRGIKNLPPADQSRLVDACRADRQHRLSLVSADSILLENGDLPIFISAPDAAGNVTKRFAKDIPGCLESVKVVRNARERKVKFEEVDMDVPASSTSDTRASHARAAKNKAKPKYGITDSEESLSDLTEDDTPRVKSKGGTAKKYKTPAIVPETPSPDRVKVAPAKDTQPAPSKGNTRARSQVDASNPTTPKKPTKAITAAEFSQGGFEKVDFGILKRGSEATAQEGPASKKLKPTEKSEVPKPPSMSSSRAQTKGPTSSGQLPPAPHHLPHPQALGGDGSSTSAPQTAATPPPLPPPPFQWQSQGPSSSNAPYPMPYHPAMYGIPPAHPHALPSAHQPPTSTHPAHPQPGVSAPAPANMPPEMMAAMQTLQAFMQAGPWGYQPPPAGPGR
ncbi:hypothetical protein PQX77_020401 [Marasmius sp. AFHP31]|nr:hypothetical protein PQX77_020401 [Marasmius sp. AFHP31]